MSFLFAGLVAGAGAQSVSQLTIHADQPGHAISPTFYGLMTEEINHAYDGGLYAELIRNRALMDRRDSTPGW
jgi:alpha-N-arabinofuranosidase